MFDTETINICVRLLMAVVCGGVIGSERGIKGRAAGLRTHILVCLGAALAMMVNNYIAGLYGTGDPARMGAQVISGIGFLGVGTILVTGRQQVKGLTTAAGLWASACMGLAIGIGYYKGAILAFLFICFVEFFLSHVDKYLYSHSKIATVYVELDASRAIRQMITDLEKSGVNVSDMEIIKSSAVVSDNSVAAVLTLRLPRARRHSEVAAMLQNIDGVLFVKDF